MPDDDDRDPYPPPWYSGRPPTTTPGAVLETYADTYALDVDCTGSGGCGALAGTFCHWPTGRQRKTPCGSRKARAAAMLAATSQPVNLDGDSQ